MQTTYIFHFFENRINFFIKAPLIRNKKLLLKTRGLAGVGLNVDIVKVDASAR